MIIHKFKFLRKCEDCDSKNNLIISRYTVGILGTIHPSEYRCGYHYRRYHNVKHDDFITQLDNKETRELAKLTRLL